MMRKRLACARGAHAPEVPPLLAAAVTAVEEKNAGQQLMVGGQILDALLQGSAVDRVR
jgi:hypothetical protein